MTVPDCRRPSFAGCFVVTALVSVIWIGAASWFVIVWSLAVGCVLRVPLLVMSSTVLGIGSTVPTALVSLVAARQARVCFSFLLCVFHHIACLSWSVSVSLEPITQL